MASSKSSPKDVSAKDTGAKDTGAKDAKAASGADHNPKTNPKDVSNQIKDPDEWTTGGEPMTGAQASYLKTLSEEAKEPEAFDENLGKAEASKRIDDLRHKAGHA
jgi:hypothetical protein